MLKETGILKSGPGGSNEEKPTGYNLTNTGNMHEWGQQDPNCVPG
jgi:hypothetical protein